MKTLILLASILLFSLPAFAQDKPDLSKILLFSLPAFNPTLASSRLSR
jgi:hypothetical protein